MLEKLHKGYTYTYAHIFKNEKYDETNLFDFSLF